MTSTELLFLCLSAVHVSLITTLPVGCTYDTAQIMYTCDARAWSLPLVYSDFNTGQPQRLTLSNVAGNIASNTFSGFSSINTAIFDSRFVPSLHILCYANSDIIIDGSAFADFSYIDEVMIVDCNILSLPAEVFKHFGDLNMLRITGGSIDNMHYDAFTGLDIKPMTQYPTPLGELGIINCKLIDSELATGALYSVRSIDRVHIESAHLTTMQTDMFSALTGLTFLSLSHNPFTALNNNLFSGTTALATVKLFGIDWHCSCSALWFVHYVKDNNITLEGDLLCATPSSTASK